MDDIIYNVLWIDDEHESLSGTKGRAKRNGINLIPFKSLNGGMSELERNYPQYDGVLLDAMIFENEDDDKGTETTYNVHRAKERLLQLKKKFKIFVLTGQPGVYESRDFNQSFTKVYNKGSDDEIDRLFVDIKEAASCQKDTQLRHKYKRVFDVCTEKYLGEFAGQDLLKLLKVEDELNIEDNFNAIRKIIEDLFLAFHKFDLLPIEFVNPYVALNPSSRFLAGIEQTESTGANYKKNKHLVETHLPRQIAHYLKNILAVTQSGSHRSNIDQHVHTVKTPFLFKSVFFQLLDVLIWFKIYVDSNPKTHNWAEMESTEISKTLSQERHVSGKVINVSQQKGFAFFMPDSNGENVFIPPHLVNRHSLNDNMAIQVEIEEYTDHGDENLKTRVKRIVK